VVPAHSFKFAAALQAMLRPRTAPDAHPHRDACRARRGQADRQAHRRARRHLGFLAKTFGMEPQWSEADAAGENK
jgi:hypothetical protein